MSKPSREVVGGLNPPTGGSAIRRSNETESIALLEAQKAYIEMCKELLEDNYVLH